MDSTDQLIKERGATYGSFTDAARTAQALKRVISNECKGSMPDYQREALDFIMTKVARLVCGDSNHEDTWADIAGYARLVVDRLPKAPAPPVRIIGAGGGKDRECIELPPRPAGSA